jgi:hypothetical protein
METMTLSAIEHHADLISRAGRLIAHFLLSTEPEKRSWSPSLGEGCEGRSAMEQVAECIGINSMLAAMMRGEQVEPGEDGHGSPKDLEPKDAARRVAESADNLASAIREGGAKVLDAEYQLPFGTFTGWAISEICMANMYYHCGQINYIQLLYGDKEFHFPR